MRFDTLRRNLVSIRTRQSRPGTPSFAIWTLRHIRAAFEQPTLSSDEGGPQYVRDNYQGIRRLLGISDEFLLRVARFDEFDVQIMHHISNWWWIFNQFSRLAGPCEWTVRHSGSALTDSPELLAVVDRIQSGVEGEQQAWIEFQENRPVRRAALELRRSRQAVFPGEQPEPPEEDILPSDAISNLLVLAVHALGLIVTITLYSSGLGNRSSRSRHSPKRRVLIKPEWT